ncbi:hypothetical protein N7468_007469 [Penicillium chermesinum]|uniref:Nucleoporin Nup54 alpha-helical domain-containing protein n=1 Tax=Penicillium chermesinum TaxID=63820 RepID=A0A9W9NUC1_9EURO|nr:uncharacterized protein N7468_007469 [Penicillium chermesinum]KAJ5226244.1 hypothetical protein N7468_007469 [Penicillium chermesinum]
MSLFGQPQTQTAGGSLFGNAANKSSSFGGFGASTTTPAQPASGGGLFGGGQTQNQQQGSTGGGLFGSTHNSHSNNREDSVTGLFGGGLGQSQQPQQPQQSGGLFGQGQQNQTQQPSTGGGLFGGGGAFGSTQQTQQQPQQQGSLFGGGLGGQQQQQPQQQQQQQQQQTSQPQQSQFGQTTMVQPQPNQPEQSLSSSLWSPGRAISGVHRTVDKQMRIVQDKWDTGSPSSGFRAYLYNNVGEDSAPFYQPGPDDDATKWEEALRKRPNPGFVPVQVRGFLELGKRAQRQKDFLSAMQTRLHEINNSLTNYLSRHDLKITLRIADCRRRHLVLSKRCLALAAKTQVLRNRGYAMDEAEEELKKKLTQLERSVFDPSLSGRGEEIWARMLAIHEQSKRLQAEMERAGTNVTANSEDEIDEETMKTAKKILDDYHAQIQHLQKELASIKKEFDEAQKLAGN